MQTQMYKTESIVKARQMRTSQTILDIQKTENERDEEQTTYKTTMQALLRERLKQGKAKTVLDHKFIKLEARMNGL